MVKRFAFRDSIDESICSLHVKIRDGKMRVLDGFFSSTLCKELMAK